MPLCPPEQNQAIPDETVPSFSPREPGTILPLVRALCEAALHAGDGWVSVLLQDENPAGNKPGILSVCAEFTGWQSGPREAFSRLRLPEPLADYLAGIPFNNSGGVLEFTFSPAPPRPSEYTDGILAEMRRTDFPAAALHRLVSVRLRRGHIHFKVASIQ